MHGDRAAPYGEPGDVVRRHRCAAARQPYGGTGQIRDGQDAGGGGLGRGTRSGAGGGTGRGRVLGALAALLPRGPRQPPGDGEPGGGRTGVVEPLGGRAGGGVGRHQEVQAVAVVQDGGEGGEAAVDPGAEAAVRRLAVPGVGGVDAARPGGQADGAVRGAAGRAARAEDGDLPLLRQVVAQRGPEGVRIGGGALPLQEAREPPRAGRVGPFAVRGVRAVRGGVRIAQRDHPGLGDPVHLVRTDQRLGDLAELAGDGGVQRLVEVELRGGDEVLELGDHRGEAGVQLTQDRIAVGVLGHQDQQPPQVRAGQLAAGQPHPVHGDEMPRPHQDFGRDPGLVQGRTDPRGDGGERVGADGVLGDQAAGGGVLLRMQDREDQVLQLGLERLDSQPFGERNEHIAGDLGDPGLFLGAHHAEGAHVVQPVGELDGHHPHVVAGGDEHLAEGLGLRRGAVVDLLQLGDPVDQIADLGAEPLPHLIERHFRVLDGVVEQGGGQGGGLGAQFGEDEGDRQRVGDVRLAALAHLAAVGGLGQHIRLAQDVQIGVGVVAAVHLGDVFEGVGEAVAAGRPEQRGTPDTAQAPHGRPGPGTPAPRCVRALGVSGLCAHGHLRRRRPAAGRPPSASHGNVRAGA